MQKTRFLLIIGFVLPLLLAACSGRHINSAGDADAALSETQLPDQTQIVPDSLPAPDADVVAADATDASTYPPPKTDVVAAVGTNQTVDIAAWNLENFPKGNGTISDVADLIASMQLDLIAVEEISSEAAFNELVARLPGYAGKLSTFDSGFGTPQKEGVIYRTSLLSVYDDKLLFDSAAFSDQFPRPPLQVSVSVKGTSLDFILIVVHLKAGIGNDDRARRKKAVLELENYVRTELVDGPRDDDVIILGDFNETLTGDYGNAEVWKPFTDNPSRYTIATQTADNQGAVSYLPFGGRLIDHQVVTASLLDDLAGHTASPIRIDNSFSNYQARVSDHVPVVLSIPIP